MALLRIYHLNPHEFHLNLG
jgi:hypothetical protein